jgi:oligopeptide/dipeptide ABC transporter ATP-binding protein
MALLELCELEVEYRRPGRNPIKAVAGVDLTVESGEIVGLVGESGCGKSTLAKATVGLQPISSGSISFNGQPLKTMSRRRRSRDAARLQLVFQNPFGSLNPRRRIGDQVADALQNLNLCSPGERPIRVRSLLEQVGIGPDSKNRYPHQFSGGQRQRIAIARALAAEPTIIVMDEPLSSLDVSAQAEIANLLVKVSSTMRLGILLISHDLAIVRQVADKVAVMYLGLIVEVAQAKDLWTAPLHPYTQALMKSIPSVDEFGVLPEALSGEVPDAGNPPSGCRFHPRCPHAFDRCKREHPPLVSVGMNRKAACWLVAPT